MAEIGSAFLSILPSAKGFGSKLQSDVGSETSGAGKKLGSGFGKVFAVAAGAVAAVGVAQFLGGAIADAQESQKISALTEQVIKTTGGAAKVTATQVQDLAGSIAMKTGVDDAAIQSASNLLLTFTNLRNEVGKGNDIFNQATQIATDMGAALGSEPKAAAIQLGKALNDPIKGVGALSRVGVSFTEQQKKVIESLVATGDTAGAQKIILAELNKEFGGAAEAQATAADKAAFAFGELKEQIGTALLPIVDALANRLLVLAPIIGKTITGIGGIASILTKGDFAGKDSTFGFAEDSGQVAFLFKMREALIGVGKAVVPFADAIRDRLVIGFDLLRDVFTALQPTFTRIGDFFAANPAVVKAFAVALTGLVGAIGAVTLATTLFSIALNTTGIPLIIIGIAALAAGLVVAYQKSETFRSIVDQMGAAIKDFATFIKNDVAPVVLDLARSLGDKMRPIVQQLGETFRSDILPAVEKLVAKFREMQPAIQTVIGVMVRVYAAFLRFYFTVLSKVLPVVIRFAGAVIDTVVPAVVGIIDALTTFVGFVRNRVVPVVLKIASTFLKMAKFGIDAFALLLDAAFAAFEGILTAAQKGLGWIPGLGGKIKGAKKAFSEFRDSVAGDLGSLATKVATASAELDKLAKPRKTTITTTFVSKYVEVKAARDASIGGGAGGDTARRTIPGLDEKTIPGLNGKTIPGLSPRVLVKVGSGIGIKLMQGLKDGVTKKQKETIEAIRKVVDSFRSQFDSLKDAAKGLASSVADAFRPDLLSGNLANLFSTGQQSVGQLKSVIAAFKKLKKFGLNASFLSDLYASGNTGLILDLAGDRATARNAQSLFNQTNALSKKLGSQVAGNEYAPQFDNLGNRFEKAIDRLGNRADKQTVKQARLLAAAINGAAVRGRRDARV